MDIPTIHKRIRDFESYKAKNRTAQEALKDELENDPGYLEACEELKTALEKRKRVRAEILAKTETQKLISDIKENKAELTTLEDILSAELMEYYQEKETDEIEDEDGQPRRFKILAKLLPKNKKYDDRDSEGQYAAKVEPFSLPDQEN